MILMVTIKKCCTKWDGTGQFCTGFDFKTLSVGHWVFYFLPVVVSIFLSAVPCVFSVGIRVFMIMLNL